ncbi:polysaccharide biosynthesis C-terminal domain-containing protein [Aerococcus sp. NPDC058936]|uniref:polysaccharide biosynthesis C-terminal domain-containing protein n=1 Tax=Aerococcus sp. NPDC058936 TaxID=3346674 RepID=UPI00366D7EB1
MYLKKTKYISIGTVMAAVLNIVLNILVIPSYGYIGAAYTTLIGYIFLYLVHYYMSNKMLEGADVIGNKFILFWSLFMVAISFIFNFLTDYLIIRYILLVVIFAVILMLFRKEIPEVIKLTKKIFKRK